jgi:tRNA(Ser,Leu) C12 N-acetylase TAN1
LLELGYAAKAIGWDRIICIINSDYGMHEELPFDLITRRILSYSSCNSDKKEIKNRISRVIEKTIEALISNEML